MQPEYDKKSTESKPESASHHKNEAIVHNPQPPEIIRKLEQALIASLMHPAHQESAFREISDHHYQFKQMQSQDIWTAIHTLKTANKTINISTVGEQMEKTQTLEGVGGGLFLAELMEITFTARYISPIEIMSALQAHLKEIKNQSKIIKLKKGEISFVPAPKNTKHESWLIPDLIPRGVITIFAGLSGYGRTTTTINFLVMNATKNLMPGSDQRGDGRPSLYIGPENPMKILKKIIVNAKGKLYGENASIVFPKFKSEKGISLAEMDLLRSHIYITIIEAIKSGQFATVCCDPIYILLENPNKGAGDRLLEIAKACQETETAFLGPAHIKKQIADQEVLHHIRGDGDIVNLARSVLYLRQAKEKSQRIIVSLKNSFLGDPGKGLISTWNNQNSSLSFETVIGERFSLLKEHGLPLNALLESPKDTFSETLITDIKSQYTSMKDGRWKTSSYYQFIKKQFKRGVSRTTSASWLKKCGLESRQTGDGWFIFKKK